MGLFEKLLRSSKKDWGNNSKSAKRAMKNARKQEAKRKFTKDQDDTLTHRY